MPSRQDVYPRWFYYSNEYQEQTPFSLLDNVLIQCVSHLSILRGKSKKDRVRAILSHFVATQRRVMQSSKDQLPDLLSTTAIIAEGN